MAREETKARRPVGNYFVVKGKEKGAQYFLLNSEKKNCPMTMPSYEIKLGSTGEAIQIVMALM